MLTSASDWLCVLYFGPPCDRVWLTWSNGSDQIPDVLRTHCHLFTVSSVSEAAPQKSSVQAQEEQNGDQSGSVRNFAPPKYRIRTRYQNQMSLNRIRTKDSDQDIPDRHVYLQQVRCWTLDWVWPGCRSSRTGCLWRSLHGPPAEEPLLWGSSGPEQNGS